MSSAVRVASGLLTSSRLNGEEPLPEGSLNQLKFMLFASVSFNFLIADPFERAVYRRVRHFN